MADDPSDASGIFTMDDGGSSAVWGGGQSNNPFVADDESEILSNYPALDDESAIITEEDVMSSSARAHEKMNVTDSALFEELYNLDTSLGGNTEDMVGNYAKSGDSGGSPGQTKKGSWLSDTLQLLGIPMATFSTEESSPDKSRDDGHISGTPQEGPGVAMAKDDDVSALSFGGSAKQSAIRAASAGSLAPRSNAQEDVQSSKLCGVSVLRLIMISGCLVILALTVVVVAVLLSDSDNDSNSANRGGDNRLDIINILTPAPIPGSESPTLSPTTLGPISAHTNSPSQAPVIPSCPPDDDSAVFVVQGEEVGCAWLLNQQEVVINVICENRQDAATSCRTTCGFCATTIPTSSPTAFPTTSPTSSPTIQPTISPTEFRITPLPTAPTDPPTLSPSSGPTNLPTTRPTLFPTTSPSFRPTQRPSPSPTRRPSPSPTLRPTPYPTSAPSLAPVTPSVGQPTSLPTTTSNPTPVPPRPTSVPTIALNCDPDLPGPIPGFNNAFRTCAWLRQTSDVFRLPRCQPGQSAFVHCPTTCRSCA